MWSCLSLADSHPDERSWSIDPSGIFTVSSLCKFSGSSFNSWKDFYAAIWKSKCPNKVCLLSWNLIGKVNMANTLQKKLHALALSPSIRVLSAASGECQLHVLFQCSFAAARWEHLFHQFSET